jgi:hypothetical protein
MSINDITGDKLVTKTASKEYLNNYDTIFRKKSMKVYIDKDAIYEFFMWDAETVEILQAEPTVEVPLEFVKEYREFIELRTKIQEKLEKYYESV